MRKKRSNRTNQQSLYTYNARPSRRLRIGIVTLFIVMIVAVVVYFYMSHTWHSVDQSYSNLLVEPAPAAEQRDAKALVNQQLPISVLLIGVDEGEQGRLAQERASLTSLLILSPQAIQTPLFQLAADIQLTDIAPLENGTVETIYATHQLSELRQLSHRLLNVPIDYTIEIRFAKLRAMIDQLNGIEITPETAYQLDMQRTLTANQVNSLTGREAVLYMQRQQGEPANVQSQRQLKVLEAIIKKMSNWTTILSLQQNFSLLQEAIRTDLPFDLLVQLGQSGYFNGIATPDVTYIQGRTTEQGNVIDEAQMQQIKGQLNQLIEKQ